MTVLEGTEAGFKKRSRLKILDGYDPDTGEWKEETSPTKPLPTWTVPRLLLALRTGAGLGSAAAYAKVDYGTVQRWREMGRMFAADALAHASDGVGDRMDLDVGERVYVDFAMQLEFSAGNFEVELATIVRTGVANKPELALQVLGRRFAHWREQKAVDVTSAGESLVQDRIASVLAANPQVALRGEEFALALEEAETPAATPTVVDVESSEA